MENDHNHLLNEKINERSDVEDILSVSQENVMYRYDYSSGLYDYMSSGIIDLTGYTKEEINKIGFSSIIKKNIITKKEKHTIKRDDKREFLQEYYGKYLIQTKNNEKRWIEDTSFILLNEAEELLLSTGVMRNVTTSYILTEKLIDEKGKMYFILDMAQVIIIVLDKNFNFTFINNKGCELSGYDKQEMLTKNLFDFVSPNLKSEIQNSLNNFLAAGTKTIKTLEVPLLTKKGDTTITTWQIIILHDENNEIYFVASAYDVTEQRREEKVQKVIMQILEAANTGTNLEDFFKYIHYSVGELMNVNNFYIALYDKNSGMINFPYFIDQFDEVSPPKRFGKGLTELVLTTGKSQLITKKKDRELVKKGKIELLGSECAIWLGVPLKIKDDSIGAIVVQDYKEENTYTKKEKEILEFIAYAIARAIERKKVEGERNFLIQELKENNKSKDKLFSIISHDLKGPFNSLLGFSEILTNEYETLTSEEIKEYISILHESSKLLYSMTNNLLQFSRFQMGKIEFKPQKIIFNKLVSAVISMLKGNAIKKQISINVEIPPNLELMADEEMISSVIQNLVNNSIKFTETGGDITISAESKHEEENYFIEIMVSDTGVGMSQAELDKLESAELFSTPGTEKEYGTGLGLNLVKEFLEKHGGKLIIQSEKNVGSTFIARLPITG